MSKKTELEFGSFLTPMCKRLNKFRCANGLLTTVRTTVVEVTSDQFGVNPVTIPRMCLGRGKALVSLQSC